VDGPGGLAQNPFAVLTLIAAPALLTNAASLLAMSTVNRILRASDRMRALSKDLESEETSDKSHRLLVQVNRTEKQALILLRALRSIYIALGCFAAASFISVIGATLANSEQRFWFRLMGSAALIIGSVGVGGLMWGCVNLLLAVKVSLLNITEEAAMIREREQKRASARVREVR